MQRQTSILSFFQKPSPENHKSGAGEPPSVRRFVHPSSIASQSTKPNQYSDEIRGTETPPEKVPRQIFPMSLLRSNDTKPNKPSPFSSILHKFAKVDDRVNPIIRGQESGESSNTCSIIGEFNEPKGVFEGAVFQHVETNKMSINGKNDKPSFTLIESDEDDLGPETPGMTPLVPRLKRFQDEYDTIEDKSGCSLMNTGKRAKLLQAFNAACDKHGDTPDENATSKFEWPDSSKLRDANGKRPGNTVDDKSGCSLMNTGKRAKLLQAFNAACEKHGDAPDANATSKFEWLDPSKLRDANGKRPGDALYDKRTLYIPPEVLRKMSASQKQYWSIKSQYMDVLLFFKVGKFYELYEVDAEIGHKELDWKMTFSGVGKCRQVGISENGIDDAVQKLIDRGYKVGRIEQLETSDQSKARGANSVIQRKLISVITPSTAVNDNIGPDAVHLLALKEGTSNLENGSTVIGFAFVDCAALKFWFGSISDDASFAALGALLMQVSPKEVVYESQGLSKEAQKALRKHSLSGSTALQLCPVQPLTGFIDASEVRHLIKSNRYFKGSCDFCEQAYDGVMHYDLALCALGGLIGHLSRLKLDDTLYNGDIIPYQVYSGCLRMDGQTLVNLEIFGNSADGGYSGTLYKYLNNCITPSGKRLLRYWLCHPLRDIEEINNRLNVVEDLVAHPEVMSLVAQYLRKLPDLERLFGRIKASAHSSASIILPLIGKKILRHQVKVFGSLVNGLRVSMDLLMLLQNEGHISSSISTVLNLPVLSGSDGLYKFLSEIEAAVKSDFPNYQDHDVTDSDAETLSILIELFVERASQYSHVIHAIKCIDVLRSFAITITSSIGAMSRPVVLPHSKSTYTSLENKGPLLKIKGLWHPFALEENGVLPVPNDIDLGQDTEAYHPRTLLLTGPNMGGKSTILRATCLAVILAQLGTYVPCEMCVVSLVDIIFTRLGATDRIMTGESTFFIECTETASVLHNATQDSLVLLDELGRGTSTFDGYAIAYSVFRHLVEKVNCRLLLATHYHPLTKEFASHPHVMLQHMACTFRSNSECFSKSDQELVFLYRLAPGACPESYGLQVALMAGIPKRVVESASKAARLMKKSVGESFKSSEQRSEFSTLHEGWLKSLVTITKFRGHQCDDEDAFDELFCLWHELKRSYRSVM